MLVSALGNMVFLFLFYLFSHRHFQLKFHISILSCQCCYCQNCKCLFVWALLPCLFFVFLSFQNLTLSFLSSASTAHTTTLVTHCSLRKPGIRNPECTQGGTPLRWRTTLIRFGFLRGVRNTGSTDCNSHKTVLTHSVTAANLNSANYRPKSWSRSCSTLCTNVK